MPQLNIGLIGGDSWGEPTPNAYKRVSDSSRTGVSTVLKAICAPTRKPAGNSPVNGYERLKRLRVLVKRADIDVVDICGLITCTRKSPWRPPRTARWCGAKSPLAHASDGAEMVAAVEKAGVRNMVWYNYRRILRCRCQSLIDEGNLGPQIIITRAQFCRIGRYRRRCRKGSWNVAFRSAGSRVGRDRGFAGTLHRHRHLAERLRHPRQCHD